MHFLARKHTSPKAHHLIADARYPDPVVGGVASTSWIIVMAPPGILLSYGLATIYGLLGGSQ
jgi:hypothetical protein